MGGGRVVDIRWVDVHRIANYLSKYLTKDLILSAPRGTRRYTTSRDIQMFARRAPTGWWLVALEVPIRPSARLGHRFSQSHDGGLGS